MVSSLFRLLVLVGVKFVKICVKSQYNKKAKFFKNRFKNHLFPIPTISWLLVFFHKQYDFFFIVVVGMYILFSVGIIMTNPRVLSMCASLTAKPARMWSFAVVQEGVMRTALDLCPVFSFQWNPRFMKRLYHHFQTQLSTHWAADKSWLAPFTVSLNLPSRGSGIPVTIIIPKQGRDSSFLE